MKETIEFERPEGLPDDAVPTVVYVGKNRHSDSHGYPYMEYWPNGTARVARNRPSLEVCKFNIPEEKHNITITGLTTEDIQTLRSVILGRIPDSTSAALMKLLGGLDTYLANMDGN